MFKSLVAVACLIAISVSAAEIPRKAPDFAIQMNGAKPLQLSQYRGKPVVLAFILTTCPHCQFTTGLLVKLQTEFAAKGFQVLECAINDGAAAEVPNFIKQFKTNFPVGYNMDQDALVSFLQFPPTAVPHMPILVFIDRKGVIHGQYQGTDPLMEDTKQEQNLRAEIVKLLAVR
jgi:peroxiredoxin